MFCKYKQRSIHTLTSSHINAVSIFWAEKIVFKQLQIFDFLFECRFYTMTPVHEANGTATSSRASSTVVMNQEERINGWSCPWHPLQFVAWFFLLAFSVSYFGVFVFYLPKEWQAAGFIVSFYDVNLRSLLSTAISHQCTLFTTSAVNMW